MSPSPREIELKLEVSTDDLRRLQRHPRLRALGVGRASSRRLRSVYYDTPELDLHLQGIGLRVRPLGRQRIQTVKTAGSSSAGLFERGEYECVVPTEEPDLARIPDPALRDSLQALVAGKGLVEIFVTEMRRTSRVLSDGHSEWTLDVDQGEVRTEDACAPISEVELELREGDPGCLFDLALDLASSVDLAPATLSKAARGYALLTGARPVPVKAADPALEKGRPLEDVLDRVVRSCLAQITDNAVPAADGADPEGVHQMRVGARRLRSALSCFRDVLPARQRNWLRAELRWLAGCLGGARDLDVFAEELLTPIFRQHPHDPALKHLRDEAAALRAERQDALRAALGSERYVRLVLTLGRWLARREWREQPLSESAARLFAPGEEHAKRVLRRVHRKARRLGRDLETAPTATRHELRLQLKKLRYAVEFFSGLYEAREARRYRKRVQALQDLLGQLNDVASAEQIAGDLLVRLGSEAAPEHERAAGFVVGWAAHRALQDDAELLRRWRRFEHTRVFWR